MKNFILTTFVAILTFGSFSKATELKTLDGFDENTLNRAAVIASVVKCGYIKELTPAISEKFLAQFKNLSAAEENNVSAVIASKQSCAEIRTAMEIVLALKQ